MKKFLLMSFSVLAAAALMSSCDKENHGEDGPIPIQGDIFEDAVPTGYYAMAEISVPAATDKVYIEYKYVDGTLRTIEQPVSPKVAVPTGGKDVEPFGTVTLLFSSEKPAKVNRVYYLPSERTKAAEDSEYLLVSDLPISEQTSGLFGVHRYVQGLPESFYLYRGPENNYQGEPTYPKDVVFYDKEHDHTLRYKFAYAGSGNGKAYFLDDAYVIENYVVKGVKYDYCGGCGNCAQCMPWGCGCNCKTSNPDFKPNGNLTASVGPEGVAIDPETPGSTPLGDDLEAVVDEDNNIGLDFRPEDVVEVSLPEPASYVTTDEDYTMYHSSGVVMFDDRWPNLPDVDYLYDYNDVVVDYDIEALTVSEDFLATQGWREQVKVTLHMRALGGDDAIGAGVVLENFNTDFVDYVDTYMTLDSWQNAHGELPVWTKTTLQENSLRYDNLPGAYPGNTSNLRPAAEMGRLQALNSVDGKSTGGLNSGNEVYQYNGTDHVFNPARKLYAAWGGAHEDQYDGSLGALYQSVGKSLSNAQNLKLYNTIPGYINVSGGLYTFTVIYHMKPRAEMDAVQSAACKANMVDAVVNTTAQNFYLVKKDHGTVGLKGYQPLDCPVKDFPKGYKAKYEEVIKDPKYAANFDLSTTYKASNGMVWGFKCPTLTRHAWELMPFAVAYPHYKEWVSSNGESHADWYKDSEVNPVALVCEW